MPIRWCWKRSGSRAEPDRCPWSGADPAETGATADRHRFLDVVSAWVTGRGLHGPHPRDVLSTLAWADVRAVAREYAASWPTWGVTAQDRVGAHTYAVRTMCRIAHLLATGEQASTRAAAIWVAAHHPASAELIGWASRWWYGTEQEPDRFEEVRVFIDTVSAEAAARPGTGSATPHR